ncbi:hypothetical protein VCR29J2_370023 [Vibrio coralliirubri]|nr:hypothetical protein VCR29J2_370023 [Vibrio coralliirubri]
MSFTPVLLQHQLTKSLRAPTVKEKYEHGFCPRDASTLRFEIVCAWKL